MKVIVKEPLKNAVIKEIKCKYAIEAAEEYLGSHDVTSIDTSSDGYFGIMVANNQIIDVNTLLELKQLEGNEDLSMLITVANGPNRQKMLALKGTVILVRVDERDRLQDVTDFDIHATKKIVDLEIT